MYKIIVILVCLFVAVLGITNLIIMTDELNRLHAERISQIERDYEMSKLNVQRMHPDELKRLRHAVKY